LVMVAWPSGTSSRLTSLSFLLASVAALAFFFPFSLKQRLRLSATLTAPARTPSGTAAFASTPATPSTSFVRGA